MKFSGKMCFKILKVTKNQGSTLSIEDFKTPQGVVSLNPSPPPGTLGLTLEKHTNLI